MADLYYKKYKKYKGKYLGGVRFDDESERRKQRIGNISNWRKNNPKILPWNSYLTYNLYELLLGKPFQPLHANQSIPGDPTPGPCANQGHLVYLHYDYQESTYICKKTPPTFEEVASFMYNVLVPALDNIPEQDEDDYQELRHKDIGRISRINQQNQQSKKVIDFWKDIIDKELAKRGLEFTETPNEE